MNQSSFWRLPSGRLLTFACGLALVSLPGAVILKQAGHDWVVGVSSLTLIVVIALCVVAVGLATDESPGWATLCVLLLPVFLFAFYFMVGYAEVNTLALVYPFIPLGLVSMAMSLRPSPSG